MPLSDDTCFNATKSANLKLNKVLRDHRYLEWYKLRLPVLPPPRDGLLMVALRMESTDMSYWQTRLEAVPILNSLNVVQHFYKEEQDSQSNWLWAFVIAIIPKNFRSVIINLPLIPGPSGVYQVSLIMAILTDKRWAAQGITSDSEGSWEELNLG